jgi:MFS family permease
VNDLPGTSSLRKTAWLVVALLFPVALLNYLDRQMLATMKASMVGDIPSIANKADWGVVLASFKWVYAALSPIGGYVADRFSRRHVICLSLLIWSCVTWFTGHVTSFHQLVGTRALMGISEAFYIPTALALIAEFHSGGTRSKAVGIHQAGIYCGLILGGFAGHIADAPQLGWRWAFNLCGFLGVIYAFPLFALLRNPSRSGHAAPSTSPAGAIVELFGNPNYLLLLAYFTLPAIAGWVVRDWMPEILRERFSLGQGQAGVTAVLWLQIASLVGVVLGGAIADGWSKTTPRGRIFTSAIGMVLFLPALVGVGHANILGIAVGALIVFGIGWGFFDCNNMPILCSIARPELRATGYGIMNLMSISCGGFGDWGFGWLRDRNVPLDAIFGAFAGVALLSILVVLLIRPQANAQTS